MPMPRNMKYRIPIKTGPERQLNYGWVRGWDDLKFPVTQTKRGSNDLPNFDYTNIGLLFPANDTSEKIYVVGELPHRADLDEPIRPHIHFIQESSTLPNFVLEYRWMDNGTPANKSWTTITTDEGDGVQYEYDDSGFMMQVIKFSFISPEFEKISSMFDFVIYRDDNRIANDVLVKEIDVHFVADNIGTFYEFEK